MQSRLKVRLQATDEEMAKTAKTARQIGKSTQFSATEVASAQLVLVNNGRNLEEVNGALLKSTLDLSAAMGADASASADILTDALSQFNLDASKSTEVVNNLVGVTLASKFQFNDARLALAEAGATAAGAGVSFDELATFVASTAQNFSSGATAGTALKTFINTLVPTTKSAKDKMKELGLEFFDAQGNIKSVVEITKELEDATKGLTAEQRLEAFKTLFGTEGVNVALGLLQTGVEGVEEAQKRIANTNAAEVAAANFGAVQKSVKLLQSAWESLQLTLGKQKDIAGAIDKVTSFINVLEENSGALKAAGKAVATLAFIVWCFKGI